MTDAGTVTYVGSLGRERADAEFRRVFLAEYPAVVRHLTYLLGERHSAEDLAQETFRTLLERRRAGEDMPDNVRAWLLKVASNLAHNHFRAETRRAERELRAARPEAVEPEETLDVRSALAALEPRDRLVLMLRHSGFSYAEIADVVGLSASSIGTTLARAQSRFRDAYEGTGARVPGQTQGPTTETTPVQSGIRPEEVI